MFGRNFGRTPADGLRTKFTASSGYRLVNNVPGHRNGHENREFLGFHCPGAFASYACFGGAFSEKCCKNRGFGRCSVSVRLSGRSAGNTWSVNLGFFFFCQKTAFLKILRGDERFSLYFPVKSEMA